MAKKSDNNYCKVCGKDITSKYKGTMYCSDKCRWKAKDQKRTTEDLLYINAKSRAKKKGLEFNIDKEDIIVPEKCPLLGIDIKRGHGTKTGQPNSPSLDRINPDEGYIKDNIQVVSHRANTIKSNATLEELELLVKNLKEVTINE